MCHAFTIQDCRRALRDGGVTVLVLAVTATGASAQRDLRPVGPPVVDPAAAIAALANGNGKHILPAFRRDRPETEHRREGNYDLYTAAERRQLLDGLERIARGEIPTREPTKARREAFSTLHMMLHDPEIDAPELADLPVRLLRIFDQAVDRPSKGLALHALAYALAKSPPEAPEIVERLVEVAAGPGPPEALAPATAVRALKQACHAGLPALRRLAEEDLIRDDVLARHVRNLVEEGLTVEVMEAYRIWPACPEPGGA